MNPNFTPRHPTRRSILGQLALAATTAIPGWASAQARYPSRPLRIVVPFPAGTSPDVIARMLADRITKASGQPVIVENRAGANTIIGTQAVGAAPADGYTMLYTVNSFSINPLIYRKLPYRVEDFVPVTRILSVPYVLVVPPTLNVRSLPELIREAKARPGTLTYASAGIGNGTHVGMARLLNEAGISMVHVPYNSSPLADLLAGRVHAFFDPTTTALAQIKAGKLVPLAVSSAARIESLPDVPAVAESFPGFAGDSWHGILVRRGTPDDALSALGALLRTIVETPEFRTTLRDYGLTPAGGSQADFQRFLAEDSRAWAKVVKDNNIVLD